VALANKLPPVTPTGIRILTPPPLDLSDEAIYRWSESTPWYPFCRFTQSLNSDSPSGILVLPIDSDHSNRLQGSHSTFMVSGSCDDIETIQSLRDSLMRRWHDDLVLAIFEPKYPELQHTGAHVHLAPYLPPNRGVCDIDVFTILDLSSGASHLEILKYLVQLMANNFDRGHIASMIVELAQQRTNCELLRGLLDQKLLILEAFAEKLLFPAVRAKNISLIRINLEAGCDVNMTGFDTNGFVTSLKRTALQCAIELRDHELVSLLMDHGAKVSMNGLDAMLDRSIRLWNPDSLL
jgi:ankyrin repeat protein